MTTGDGGQPYYGGPDDPNANRGQGGYGYGEQYGQGGYGQQYGDAGYGQQYGQGMPPAQMPPTGRVTASDAVGAGWRMFTGNPLPWLLIVLFSMIAGAIAGSFGQPITIDPETLEPVTNNSGFLGSLLSWVVGLFIQAFSLRGALLEVDGHKPSIGDFFRLHNFGWFVVASIVVTILTALGLFVVLIGAIVVGFFLYWTTYFVIDRDMNAGDALVSSFNAIKSDAGTLFGLAALNVLIIIAGALALGVGLFVAIPVVTLASVYAYRVITGPSSFSQRATMAPGQGFAGA